jgi:hypothetical protein
MAGPWEKFQQQPTSAAPWERYRADAPSAPIKIGAEGFKDALAEEVGSRSIPARMLAGAGTFVDDAALRLKQLVTGDLSQEDALQAQSNRIIKADPWGMGGNVLGAVGALAPLGVTSIAGNAGLGAGLGFMGNPVLGGESGVGNAVVGGLAGGAGGAIGKVITGAPLVKPTEQTQRLMSQGVVPTVGQNAASSTSKMAQALGRVEERASSLPIAGDFITASRRRALEEFNRAALNKAAPAGEKVTQIGKEGAEEALTKAGQAFEDVYRGAMVGPSDELAAALTAAKDKPAAGLSEEAVKKYDRIIDRFVNQRLKPDMDAGLVKKTIESDLGKEARNFKFSTNSDDKALGDALFAARDAIRDVMNKAVGAEKAGKLAGINKSYAAGKAVEKASDRAAAQGGVFTPYQLQRAANGGPLTGLADDAQAVLASRVPNSGTADRTLQALAATGTRPNTGTIAYLLGSLGMSPVYSRFGSRFLLGDVTPQQVQALSPYLSQAMRGALYQE